MGFFASDLSVFQVDGPSKQGEVVYIAGNGLHGLQQREELLGKSTGRTRRQLIDWSCVKVSRFNHSLQWAVCDVRAVQDAAAVGGDARQGVLLWAALLRANALLPPLPADLEELHDDDQHYGSTCSRPPPGVASLQVMCACLHIDSIKEL